MSEMTIDQLMVEIIAALPEKSRGRWKTIREVCLTLDESGCWCAMAGGHPAVHLGEWGGDFRENGATAEYALSNCLKSIRSYPRLLEDGI